MKKAMIVITLVLCGWMSSALPAHASVSGDARLCQYFPEWEASVSQARRTVPVWTRYIRGADPELMRDAEHLAYFFQGHPAATATGDRWFRVYLDCNPDA